MANRVANIDLDARELAHEMIMEIRIYNTWKVHLGLWVMRLGAWIAGVQLKTAVVEK